MNEIDSIKQTLNKLYNIYENSDNKTKLKYKTFKQFYSKFILIFASRFKCKLISICYDYQIFGAKELSNFFVSNQQYIEKYLADFITFGIIEYMIDDEESDQFYHSWKSIHPNSSKKPIFYRVSNNLDDDLLTSIISPHKKDMLFTRLEKKVIHIRKEKYENSLSQKQRHVLNTSEILCLKCNMPISSEMMKNEDYISYPKGIIHKYCQKESSFQEVQEWMHKN